MARIPASEPVYLTFHGGMWDRGRVSQVTDAAASAPAEEEEEAEGEGEDGAEWK